MAPQPHLLHDVTFEFEGDVLEVWHRLHAFEIEEQTARIGDFFLVIADLVVQIDDQTDAVGERRAMDTLEQCDPLCGTRSRDGHGAGLRTRLLHRRHDRVWRSLVSGRSGGHGGRQRGQCLVRAGNELACRVPFGEHLE